MKNLSLYLKVAYYLCDKILKNDFATVASIQPDDFVAEVGVSKHIVSKSFEYLLSENILLQNNGAFCFTENAHANALRIRKTSLLDSELDSVFEMMDLYGISLSDLGAAYQKYQSK